MLGEFGPDAAAGASIVLIVIFVVLAVVLSLIAFLSLVRLFFFLGHAERRHFEIVSSINSAGVQIQQLNGQIAHLNNQVNWQNETLVARQAKRVVPQVPRA
jgi:TolA-binding protein